MCQTRNGRIGCLGYCCSQVFRASARSSTSSRNVVLIIFLQNASIGKSWNHSCRLSPSITRIAFHSNATERQNANSHSCQAQAAAMKWYLNDCPFLRDFVNLTRKREHDSLLDTIGPVRRDRHWNPGVLCDEKRKVNSGTSERFDSIHKGLPSEFRATSLSFDPTPRSLPTPRCWVSFWTARDHVQRRSEVKQSRDM